MGSWELREDYQLTLRHRHKVHNFCEKNQLLLKMSIFILAIITTMAFRTQYRTFSDQAFKS